MRGNTVLSSLILFGKGITMWELPLGKTESIFDLELGFPVLFFKSITNDKHAQIHEKGTVNVIQKYIMRVCLSEIWSAAAFIEAS